MSAPFLPKSEKDKLRSIDRNLDYSWNDALDRWEVVRWSNATPGRCTWVMTVENTDGSFRRPDNRVPEYLKEWDLANWRGSTHEERMDSFLKWKREHNDEVKARGKKFGLNERFDRYNEYRGAAKSVGAIGGPEDADRLSKHVRKDSERMKEYSDHLTTTQKNRILRGVDPVSA